MNDPRTVVVGVDESESARHVLRYALMEGERRRAVVRVITVCPTPRRWEMKYAKYEPASLLFSPLSEAAVRADLRQRLWQLVEDVRSEEPALAGGETTIEVIQGHPVQVLVEQARGADVLVVGHAGHTLAGGFGSVALGCVLRATVPVVVVRSEARRCSDAPTASLPR